MPTSVELQPLMSFSPWMLFFGILGLVASLALIFVIPRLISSRDETGHFSLSVTSIPATRLYEEKLCKLASELESGEVGARECGEQASACIREFADSVSGAGHSSMTLEEIERRSGVAGLSEAISKCYGAEFPKDPEQNAADAIEACLEVVRRWR